MKENIVTLEIAKKEELPKFKKDLQESFAAAEVEMFKPDLEEMNHLDKDMEDSFSEKDIEDSFNAPGAVIYHIVSNGEKLGGAVVVIDKETQHNSLDLFFISANKHCRGIGYKAWKAIEEKYPETKVWETHTPYFEERNIHFYVNKCGFNIVEYYNKYHADPNMRQRKELPDEEGFFRFEKVMY